MCIDSGGLSAAWEGNRKLEAWQTGHRRIPAAILWSAGVLASSRLRCSYGGACPPLGSYAAVNIHSPSAGITASGDVAAISWDGRDETPAWVRCHTWPHSIPGTYPAFFSVLGLAIAALIHFNPQYSFYNNYSVTVFNWVAPLWLFRFHSEPVFPSVSCQ